MRWIPPATFTMGSPFGEPHRSEDETPHVVTVTRGFWLMAHEVTQGEWEAVVGTNPVATQWAFSGYEGGPWVSCRSVGVGPELPVVCVSWVALNEFIHRASALDGHEYRNPSEAEWELAARGGEPFRFAGSDDASAVAWWRDNSEGSLHTVCGKRRNGFGICDLSGNAAEWVADWSAPYGPHALTDPTGPATGTHRAVRGGGFNNGSPMVRVAFSAAAEPTHRATNLGFRVALSGGAP